MSDTAMEAAGLGKRFGLRKGWALRECTFRLPAGRVYQLLRMRIDPSLGLIPEISGHRLMISIRLMRQDEEGRLKLVPEDSGFELALCQ
jgi:cell division FtsZ-interacting protein ZapD